jgi:autotransporter-associated beta strand protein
VLNSQVIDGGDVTATLNLDPSGELTFAPTLTGSLTVNKLGSGTTTLTGTNTHTGGTNLLGGTLSVGSGANLGAPTGALAFDGGTLRNTATFTTARPTTIRSGDATIQTNARFLHQGVIVGSGSLTKTGRSTLSLASANT